MDDREKEDPVSQDQQCLLQATGRKCSGMGAVWPKQACSFSEYMLVKTFSTETFAWAKGCFCFPKSKKVLGNVGLAISFLDL